MSFKGICDVNNPLLGKQGATMVFGAQKGVKDLELQEKAMTHYANKSAEVLHKDERNYPGAGAAGGLGFAIVAYLNGELVGGFDEVARLSHLEEAIKEADLVFTGEGSMDHQTLMGKTPQGVLELAKKYNKKVVGFAGKVEDKEALLEAGFYDIRCINHQEAPLHELLKKGASNLEQEVREYLKHYEI
jgi:glycerate kinase